VEGKVRFLQAVDERVGHLDRDGSLDALDRVDTLPQPVEERADLEPGQRRAEAEVGAEAERQVVVGGPGDVEGIRSIEVGRISVGGCVGE